MQGTFQAVIAKAMPHGITSATLRLVQLNIVIPIPLLLQESEFPSFRCVSVSPSHKLCQFRQIYHYQIKLKLPPEKLYNFIICWTSVILSLLGDHAMHGATYTKAKEEGERT